MRAGEYFPALYLRGPVPAGKEGDFVVGRAVHRHGRGFGGATLPREAISSVGVIVGWYAGVEEQLAVVGELGGKRFTAPADEHVAVRQHLHIALGGGDQLVGVGVLAHEGRDHVVLVELYHDPARLRVYLGPGAVVEDGDGTVFPTAGVVLPGGAGVLSHLEVALLAAEAPDHLAATAVHLVDGPRVAGGDEQVPVVVDVYGVDVEVVEATAVIPLDVGLLDADVVYAVPLEEHLPGLYVHLLGDTLDHRSRHGAAEVGEIQAHKVVDREQSRALRGDAEVVLVSPVAVARLDPLYLPVGTIEDHVLSDAGPGLGLAFPPGQHRLALVLLHLEIQRVQPFTEPHGPSHVVDDHRPVLPPAQLRGGKDVPARPATRPRVHRDGGRPEVRARAEVPRAPRRRGRHVPRGPHLRGTHGGADFRGPGLPDAPTQVATHRACQCEIGDADARSCKEPATVEPRDHRVTVH